MKLFGLDIQCPPSSPKSWDQLVAECVSCVQPVRAMIQDRGVSDTKTLDQIQHALASVMLVNLLRDVRVELIQHDRLYLPADLASKHGLDLGMLRKALALDADRGCDGDKRDASCDCALIPRGDMLALRDPFRATMRDLVNRTEGLLPVGRHDYWRALPLDMKRSLHSLVLEARSTLRMIVRHEYDTLTRRRTLGVLPRAWNRVRLKFAP